ncbi:polysaccharide biosynthesis protein [Oleisolibacter albus]|uniref:polysaccharide biosynthesis protein n=1 Tax=Oleisolibacter albus TaxID=2171757 RepID=UPI000DF193B9|nr:nucleoside-diphosphate sugar epimerase/dehydratase [Oleisolibacter albus]
MQTLSALVRRYGTDARTLATLHDVLAAALSFIVSLYLRVGSQLMEFAPALWPGLLVFTATAAISYPLVGMNSGVWRYASLRDLMAIARAVTATVLVFLALLFLVTRLELLPRSLPLINWFVLVVFLGGPRLIYRVFKDRRITGILETNSRDRIPVLLVGAADEAELFIRAMNHAPDAAFRVVGILDDKSSRVGRHIHAVPVLGGLDQLGEVVNRLAEGGERPRRLILTRPHLHRSADLGQLIEQCEALNLVLARLPDLTDFREAVETEGSVRLRPIVIEDLLGRPPVRLDRQSIGGLVAGRSVLVTGAGGTIGAELTRQIATLGPRRLVLIDHGEFNLYSIDLELGEAFPALDRRSVLADVRNRTRMLQVFQEEQPELVFHAAALKHVPMVEFNPIEGVLTNIMGTRNVADAAAACGSLAMVLISTDKAVSPTNVMGATKRVAECYCQALDLPRPRAGAAGTDGGGTRFLTVRFGNVLGSTGSVVPLFTRQLKAGGPLTVTHPEVCRYFMTVREAVELVLQASAYGMGSTDDRGRIFVLDMGQPVRIVDLARQMIRLAGLRPGRDIQIVFTGLRPGEKLYEEMFDEAEPPVRTGAEGVLVASPRAVDSAILRRSLDELLAAAQSWDEARVITLLQHIVPEFHPEAARAAGIPVSAAGTAPRAPL